MEVKCPKCGTKNLVDDNLLLSEEVVRINCSGCGVKMAVKRKAKKKAESQTVPSTPSEPPSFEQPAPMEQDLSSDTPSQEPTSFGEDGLFIPDESVSETENLDEMFKTDDFSFGEETKEEEFFSPNDFNLSQEENHEEEQPQSEEENLIQTENFGVQEESPQETEEEKAFYMPDEVTISNDLPPATEETESPFLSEEVEEEDDFTKTLFSEEHVSEPPPPTPQPEPISPTPAPQKFQPKPAVRISTTKPKKSTKSWFGIVFIILLLGGGALGYWWKFRGVRSSNTDSNFDVKITEKHSLVNRRGERIWYIKGKVFHKRGVVSKIKLRATLWDKNGFKIAEKEFYAGNLVSLKDLRTLSPFEVEGILQRETGESLSNIRVEPGKDVDFMVVFYDLPSNATLKIEVTDWKEEK